MKAIKCDLCKEFQECEKYDNIEFSTYAVDNVDDWRQVESWDICKNCKKKIKKFILSLESKKPKK